MSSRKRKHDDHEEHADESWLIPYADLMTLLLALFIVLFASSSVDVQKLQEMSKAFSLSFNSGSGVLENTAVVTTGQQADNKIREKKSGDDGQVKTKKEKQQALQELIKKEQQDMEKLKKQMDEYIRSAGLTTQLETKLNLSQLMITISDNALFPSGSAKLKPESRDLAAALSTMLVDYPEYEIVVSGHTDNEPIYNAEFESNWELSSKRAITFLNILLENKDVNPQRFSSVAYGEFQPVDSNDSFEGRAKNRRVEVSIIRKYSDPEQAEEISVSQT
ncbi:flagellar motor protein MotB [Paenibacillaceae bacterium]|nr:flagellar motor protein MotB [Paenibacillaceae bacterium]